MKITYFLSYLKDGEDTLSKFCQLIILRDPGIYELRNT